MKSTTVELPKILQPMFCKDIIRIGKENDGGYLLNEKDLKKAKHLLSFGIGEDISFEREFTEIQKCSVTAYDGTIENIHNDFFRNGNKIINSNIESEEQFQDIINQFEGDVYLKCDIDFSEYKIIYSIIKNVSKFSGISIEFHGISDYKNFNEMTNFISKLKMDLIHTHINNYSYSRIGDKIIPDVLELTFTSSNNCEYDRNLNLPHNLDMINNPNGLNFITVF